MITEEHKQVIKAFLDSYEWEEEDMHAIRLIDHFIKAPYIFYRRCDFENCMHQENGFCGYYYSKVEELPKQCARCAENEEKEEFKPFNPEVPIKTIARCLVRDLKNTIAERDELKKRLDSLEDYLKSEAYLDYRSKLEEAEAKVKQQTGQVTELQKKLEKINKRKNND